jgi:hypothetical protein
MILPSQTTKHFLSRLATWLVRRRFFFNEFATSMRSETFETRYLIVTYPHEYGWVAVMPDFRGATGRADEMESAIWQAIRSAHKVCSAMRELGRVIPAPMDLSSVKSKHRWAGAYGIDWSKAIVRTISINDLITSETKKEMNVRSLSSDPHPHSPS